MHLNYFLKLKKYFKILIFKKVELLIVFSLKSNESLEKKLHWMFQLYDINQDDFISLNEIYTLLRIIFGMKNIQEDPHEQAAHIMRLAIQEEGERLNKENFIQVCLKHDFIVKYFTGV